MRTIYFLFFLLVITSALCGQDHGVQKIVFTTQTRGYHKIVELTKDSVKIMKQGAGDRNENTIIRKMKRNEWSMVSNALDNVSLPDLSLLKSPTVARNTDAARQSTLTITTWDGKNFSHTFDNENPNNVLKPLMDAIVKLAH